MRLCKRLALQLGKFLDGGTLALGGRIQNRLVNAPQQAASPWVALLHSCKEPSNKLSARRLRLRQPAVHAGGSARQLRAGCKRLPLDAGLAAMGIDGKMKEGSGPATKQQQAAGVQHAPELRRWCCSAVSQRGAM